MKLLLKTSLVVCAMMTLVACSQKKPAPVEQPAKPVAVVPVAQPTAAPAPAPTVKEVVAPVTVDKAKECKSVKKALRKLDRNAPGAQEKVVELENKLDSLNCGPK